MQRNKPTTWILIACTVMLAGMAFFQESPNVAAYSGSIDYYDASSFSCFSFTTGTNDGNSYYYALSADDMSWAYVNLGNGGGTNPATLYVQYYGNVHYGIPAERRNHYYFTQVRVPWVILVDSSWGANEVDAVYLGIRLSTGHTYSTLLYSDWPDNTQSGTAIFTNSDMLNILNTDTYTHHVNGIYFVIYTHSGTGTNMFYVDYLRVIYYYTYELLPSAPQSLASTATPSSVTLTWSAPAEAGGLGGISEYKVYRDGSFLGSAGTNLAYTDAGLAHGETHSYSVSATNGAGEGPECGAIVARAKAPPSSPVGLAYTFDSTFINVTWNAPLDDGDEPVTSYNVYRDGSFLASSGTSMYHVDSGLSIGETHNYHVTAVNGVGEGSPSSNLTAHTMSRPFPIDTLAFTAQLGQVMLTWAPPGDNGGLTITSYKVYRDGAFLASTGTSTTFTDTGLGQGTFHNYSVTSINLIGESDPSNLLRAHSKGVPDAPGIVGITRGIRSIGLAWDEPYDMGDPVQAYKVYFDNGSFIQLYGPSTRACNISNLATNTTYGFYVTAVNGLGEGGASSTNWSRTFDVPGAPVPGSGTRGLHSVAFTWSPPAFTDGFPVTAYQIIVDGVLNATVPGGTLSYNLTGLPDGAIHDYQVRAVTVVGVGPASSNLTIAAATVPDAPANIEAVMGVNNITISWSAPVDDGGLPITRYELYRNGTYFTSFVPTVLSCVNGLLGIGEWCSYQVFAINPVGSSVPSNEAVQRSAGLPQAPHLNCSTGVGNVTLAWTAAIADTVAPVEAYRIYVDGSFYTQVGNVFSYQFSGLANDERHNYTVSAVNMLGEGPQSDVAQGRAAALPGPPRNLRVDKGVRSLVLTWEVPEDDGGIAIKNYAIYRDGSFWGNVGAVLTWIDAGLSNGEPHSYYLHAENAVGSGNPSSTVSNTSHLLPTFPQSLVAIPGIESINLTWLPPSSMDGLPVIHYNIYRDGEATPLGTTALTTYLDAGLENGTYHSYRLTATTAVGEGSLSASAGTTTLDVPSIPQSLSIANGTVSVTVSWVAPLSNGGTPILGYKVFRAGTLVAQVGAGVLIHVDSSATPGVASPYTVIAYNLVGDGQATPPATGVIYTAPSVPRSLIAVGGNGQIQLSWMASEASGGTPITGYRIYKNGAFLVELAAGVLSHVDTSLGNGVTNAYNVTAVNLAGEGPATALASATTWSTPTAPLGVSASGRNKAVVVTWSTPTSNGGSSITSYVVYRDGGFLISLGGTVLSYIDTGLADGESHGYKVAACNVVGEGAQSAQHIARTYDLPSSPLNPRVEPGINKVKVIWQAPADNGGTPVINFRLYRDGQYLVELPASQTEYTDTLMNGVETHQYRVSAVNEIGEGLESAPVQATSLEDSILNRLFSGDNLYYLVAGVAGLFLAIGAVAAVRRKKSAKTTRGAGKKARGKDASIGRYQEPTTPRRNPTEVVVPAPCKVTPPPSTITTFELPDQGATSIPEPAVPVFCTTCNTRQDLPRPVDLNTTTCPSCSGPVSRVITCPYCKRELFINKDFYQAYGGGDIACSHCSNKFLLKLD